MTELEKIRKVAVDMYNLARLLDDDDPWFGERRNAEARLKVAHEVLYGENMFDLQKKDYNANVTYQSNSGPK